MHKIIKEQLTFPSGTATAQLVSVLHHLPPPDTSIRHRTGYREVNTSDDEEIRNHAVSGPSEIVEDIDAGEREVVQHQGWSDLVWSFLASSFMTVRYHYHSNHQAYGGRCRTSCLLIFSRLYSPFLYLGHIWLVNGFGRLRQASVMLGKVNTIARMPLCLSIRKFSYASTLGIIMGCPTTLSMNLVRSFR